MLRNGSTALSAETDAAAHGHSFASMLRVTLEHHQSATRFLPGEELHLTLHASIREPVGTRIVGWAPPPQQASAFSCSPHQAPAQRFPPGSRRQASSTPPPLPPHVAT